MTGRRVSFTFDGVAYQGFEGEPLAVRLWALGIRDLGQNEVRGGSRGLYCAIGHCFECRVTVDGERDRRACLTPLWEGLRAERQFPPPPLSPGPEADHA